MYTRLSKSTLTKNYHQQSITPLVNTSFDQFLGDHLPATVQDLFLMVNDLDLLMMHKMTEIKFTTRKCHRFNVHEAQ